MPILVLQHAPTETIGRLGPTLRDHAQRIDVRRVDLSSPRGGQGVPPDYDNVTAVVVLGGAMNVTDSLPYLEAELAYIRGAHERQLPVLGVCLGAQMIAKALGGEVAPAKQGEWGFCRVTQTVQGNTDTLLSGIPWGTYQFQMHNQEVTKLPEGAVLLASSPACRVQAFRVGLRTYGFQYHFEVTRERLEAMLRDQEALAEFARAGVAAPDLQKQVAEHAETFGRVSDRLCANIATFMFPLMRARV